jgi:alkylhydroperoxidase family enzyme
MSRDDAPRDDSPEGSIEHGLAVLKPGTAMMLRTVSILKVATGVSCDFCVEMHTLMPM